MNDTEFHQLIDLQLQNIEDAIEESGADIDFETTGNVLTLEFEDRSQIIINKQVPMHEVWLASRSGGFHFQYKENKWVCSKSGKVFFDGKGECEKHAGEAIEWP